MSDLRTFITKCTLTFKAFDFDVTMSESKSTLWNFITFNPNNQKRYCVFCAPSVKKVKGLIKVALKKVPKDHRLVVVVKGHTEEEVEEADAQGFSLLSLGTLDWYGKEMLEIRDKESQEESSSDDESPSDFIDQVIHRDKIF
ncbi:MAG: hypothetical protein NXH75_05675 [Halobacteriovoraceae bacterium]|nr:hypothetical protein [Halobacteriovoraceae bacterium]